MAGMRWVLVTALAVGCGSNEMAGSGGAGGANIGSGGSGGSGGAGGALPDAGIDAPARDAAIDAAIDARPDARPDAAFFDAPFFDAPSFDAAPPCDPTQPDGGDGCTDSNNPKCSV